MRRTHALLHAARRLGGRRAAADLGRPLGVVPPTLAVHEGLVAHGDAYLAGRAWRATDGSRPLRDEELLLWIDDDPPPRARVLFATRYRNAGMLARIGRGRYLSAAIYGVGR